MSLSGAVFSRCRRYRYLLWRSFDALAERGSCCIIMLNPSVADESVNDPTSRRCIGFAAGRGFSQLVVVNLFALRATDPRVLCRHPRPVGPANDAAIIEAAVSAELVVCAWGAHGVHRDRDRIVTDLLRRAAIPLHRFGATKAGQPLHPLYLPSGSIPELWPACASVRSSPAGRPAWTGLHSMPLLSAAYRSAAGARSAGWPKTAGFPTAIRSRKCERGDLAHGRGKTSSRPT